MTALLRPLPPVTAPSLDTRAARTDTVIRAVAATAVARTAVAGDPGQAPALRITAPTRDTVISGATRIEVAVEPQDAAAAVLTVISAWSVSVAHPV